MSDAADVVRPEVPAAPRRTVDDPRALFLDGRALLDVRAPVEFAKGAFPGAINEPLLTDGERHEVGVRYRQRGQDAAIALGAELVHEGERQVRVARWKAFAEAHPEGALYCFRGGLRSRIAQHWLSEAGIELPLVTGGYKAMRTFLIGELERLCETLDLQLVGGRTGVGKTLLIGRLGRTVDLEGIARHRGSSFGALAEPQPGNIDFENRVTIELMRLEAAGASGEPSSRLSGGRSLDGSSAEASDPGGLRRKDRASLGRPPDGRPPDGRPPEGRPPEGRPPDGRPVWLEDEARLIGRVAMPERLVQAMRRAPITILEAPLELRVANCLDDYVFDLLSRYRESHGDEAGFEAYATHHRSSLDRVRKRLGGDNHALASRRLEDALFAHRERGETALYVPFIELMLERYYDPMYDYQLDAKRDRVRFAGDAAAILARASRERAGEGRGDDRAPTGAPPSARPR